MFNDIKNNINELLSMIKKGEKYTQNLELENLAEHILKEQSINVDIKEGAENLAKDLVENTNDNY